MVVMYLLKKGAFYKEKKYQIITDDDAFVGLESGSHPGYGSTQHTDGVSHISLSNFMGTFFNCWLHHFEQMKYISLLFST